MPWHEDYEGAARYACVEGDFGLHAGSPVRSAHDSFTLVCQLRLPSIRSTIMRYRL